jgi:uncharacterized membrane protein YagU involved in acid resistance
MELHFTISIPLAHTFSVASYTTIVLTVHDIVGFSLRVFNHRIVLTLMFTSTPP